jgi:hypothetical protein
LGWRRGSVRFTLVGAASVFAEYSFDYRYRRSCSIPVALRPPVSATGEKRRGSDNLLSLSDEPFVVNVKVSVCEYVNGLGGNFA